MKVLEDFAEEVVFDLRHGIEVCQEGEGLRRRSRQRPALGDGLESVRSTSTRGPVRKCGGLGRGLETG